MPDLDYREPICASHEPPVNMRPERNGVIVRLTEDRLMTADLWECPKCGARVIDRKGQGTVVERYEGTVYERLDQRLTSLGPNVVIGHPDSGEIYGYA